MDVYLVKWKNAPEHLEIFDSLSTFTDSYSRYNGQEISIALASGIARFEDDAIRLERRAVTTAPKPDFPSMFFWDFHYDRIDWRASANTVIQRILERGMPEHWQELKRFYGQDTIITALKELITYLPDACIDEAALYFDVRKEEMLCYKRKRSQPMLWL